MDDRLHFIWEAKNIDDHVKEVNFLQTYHIYINNCPLFCGEFDREVLISRVKLQVIHFTNFILHNSNLIVMIGDDLFSLNLRKYNDLTFKIIEPGIYFKENFI